MKTLIIYTSQTGFTKRYAEWIAEKMNGELLETKEAKTKKMDFFAQFDAIIYGGWAMAGSLVQSKWFLEKAKELKGKRLAMFCVGASPIESEEVQKALDNMLTDEQRTYVKAFYCPGGIDYSKMKLPSRMAMKAFVSMLNKKKDASAEEKEMASMIAKSYDISDKKYVEPIVEYLMK